MLTKAAASVKHTSLQWWKINSLMAAHFIVTIPISHFTASSSSATCGQTRPSSATSVVLSCSYSIIHGDRLPGNIKFYPPPLCTHRKIPEATQQFFAVAQKQILKETNSSWSRFNITATFYKLTDVSSHPQIFIVLSVVTTFSTLLFTHKWSNCVWHVPYIQMSVENKIIILLKCKLQSKSASWK